MTNASPVSFPATVGLLLKASRRRSAGRRVRQRELLSQRSGRRATDWGALSTMLGVLVAAFIHGTAAMTLLAAVTSSERLQSEQRGKLVVSGYFYDWIRDNNDADWSGPLDEGV